MRKYIFIALMASLALTFSSCNKGPQTVTDRYLIRYVTAFNDTTENGKGMVIDIETLRYDSDTTAVKKEYERFEAETKALVKESKEFYDSYSKYEISERDSIAKEYGKKLVECRCLMFFRHGKDIGTGELLNVVEENGADFTSDLKFAKEHHLRVQFIELHNDLWLKELRN